MKQLRQILLAVLFILFVLPLSAQAADLNTPATDVDMQRQWTIKFNRAVTESSVNQNTVYVLNNQQKKMAVSYKFSADGKSLIVMPPTTGYIPEQTYTLVVTDGVTSGIKSLKTVVNKPFTIKAVEKALVITQPAAITELYTDANLGLKYAVSYVAAQSSFELVDVHKKSLAIEVAGVVRYIPHHGATVTEDLSTQSYYQVKDGELRHSIYNYRKNSFESYIAGVAPAFLQQELKYTSSDGVTFKNPAGKIVGESYNYFQYVSVRTASHYTAEQLDTYIDEELARRNITNSKLVGLGTHLKEIEAQYKINALFLLAFAQHESNFGTSDAAQKYNNLFGIKIYDSGEQSDTYTTPQESVIALVTKYLNKTYIPATGSYANGVAAGNKYVGFNVKYASDPYWGAKIAGHMYTIDKKLGSKDYKQYDIGLIKETPKNQLIIRPIAGRTIASIYIIKNSLGKPLTLLEPVTNAQGETWYQIVSDDLQNSNAYAHSHYVNIIATH